MCLGCQVAAGTELHRFVPGDFDAFCRGLAQDGEWGDHVTLRVLATVFQRQICVYSSDFDEEVHSPFVDVPLLSVAPLCVGHLAEYHFVSCPRTPPNVFVCLV